jgi:uncharacterized protein with GYD domain
MKLTEEELQLIKDVQQRQQAVKEELGSIGQIKLNLKMRQYKLETFYSQTVDMETKLAADFQEKYGKGNIDTETGEFTPFEN